MEIIVDLFNQHSGDMNELKRMALAAWQAGADSVKIQLLNSKKIWGDDSRGYLELTKDQMMSFADFCDKHGIPWFATPFEEKQLYWLEEAKIIRYKLASWSVKNDIEFCNRVVDYAARNPISIFNIARQVIVSLGLVDNFPWNTRENIHYLYCSSEYPTLLDNEKIKKMPKDFPSEGYYGYSDHTVGIVAAIEAYRHGAQIIEKHFTMTTAKQCATEKAHLCSFTPESLRVFRDIINQYDASEF